jgi:hypothetical protein
VKLLSVVLQPDGPVAIAEVEPIDQPPKVSSTVIRDSGRALAVAYPERLAAHLN